MNARGRADPSRDVSSVGRAQDARDEPARQHRAGGGDDGHGHGALPRWRFWEATFLAADTFDEVLTWIRRLREADLPFMLVGAYAVAAHGFARTTGDIDFVVHLPFEERERVRKVLADGGASSIHDRVDPQWGKRVAADLPSGLTIEVFLTPRSPVHDREYDRRVVVDLDGERTPIVSPEDLVLRKLVNTRLRRGMDFDDAIGVVARQGPRIDLDYLRAHAGFYRVGELLERAIKEAASVEPEGK